MAILGFQCLKFVEICGNTYPKKCVMYSPVQWPSGCQGHKTEGPQPQRQRNGANGVGTDGSGLIVTLPSSRSNVSPRTWVVFQPWVHGRVYVSWEDVNIEQTWETCSESTAWHNCYKKSTVCASKHTLAGNRPATGTTKQKTNCEHGGKFNWSKTLVLLGAPFLVESCS